VHCHTLESRILQGCYRQKLQLQRNKYIATNTATHCNSLQLTATNRRAGYCRFAIIRRRSCSATSTATNVATKTATQAATNCTTSRILQGCYGVATMSRLLKIIGLFCRISSVLYGSFAKETYDFKEPTNRSHPISADDCSAANTLQQTHCNTL